MNTNEQMAAIYCQIRLQSDNSVKMTRILFKIAAIIFFGANVVLMLSFDKVSTPCIIFFAITYLISHLIPDEAKAAKVAKKLLNENKLTWVEFKNEMYK